MDDRLEVLLKHARKRSMTLEERRAQSISFVFGNANVEGDMIARSTVAVEIPPETEGEKE